ncbi:AAA family ATPase [Hansschlegelia zhihuaiae]
MSIRAAVRAHVAAGQAQADDRKAREARDCLSLARRLLEPVAPKLVAIGGFSGSGKSTVAAAIAHDVGQAPGARILGSDRIRKAMLGVAPDQKLPQEAYRADVTSRVYQEICERAGSVLRSGHGVVAEATFSTPVERSRIEQVASASSYDFRGVWLDAAGELLASRVSRRTGDVSDADVSVLAVQLRKGAGEIGWPKVEASGDALDVSKRVAGLLCRSA